MFRCKLLATDSSTLILCRWLDYAKRFVQPPITHQLVRSVFDISKS